MRFRIEPLVLPASLLVSLLASSLASSALAQATPAASDRTVVQATRMAADLMPPPPDRGRMLDALATAGLAAPPDATVEAIAEKAADGFAAWRALEEPALVARIVAGLPAASARGGLLGPDLMADVLRVWDAGLRFERDAFADLAATREGAAASDLELARHVLAAAEANALFGRVPFGTIDPTLDLVREATACAEGTGVDAATVREALAAYARERAEAARKLAEARFAMAARSGEVAMASQRWFAAKRAAAGEDEAPDPIALQAAAMVLQAAPLVAPAGAWQDLQRRGAAALEAILPPDAAWCVWAALPPAPLGKATRERIADLAASLAALPEDRRPAAEVALREFRAADLVAIRELLATEIETGRALAVTIAPSLAAGGLEAVDFDALLRSLQDGEIVAAGNRLSDLQQARIETVAALEAALAAGAP